MIFVIAIIFAILFILHIPAIKRNKQKGEFIVVLLIMAIALLYIYSHIYHKDIPALCSGLVFIFEPISKIIFGDYS